MYGGDCDAAIAKAAAPVTRVQSQSQELRSRDTRAGLLVFSFIISTNGLLVAGGRAVETSPIYVFRARFYLHQGRGQARLYPPRWLSLSSRAKPLTLKGRQRRFPAFHTSLRGPPLLVREQQTSYQQILPEVHYLLPHGYIK